MELSPDTSTLSDELNLESILSHITELLLNDPFFLCMGESLEHQNMPPGWNIVNRQLTFDGCQYILDHKNYNSKSSGTTMTTQQQATQAITRQLT